MATTTDLDLKTIHVFPSESSYNTNRGQLKEGDLALIPFSAPNGTLVEAWQSENKDRWYRKYSDGWVEQAGFSSGTVTFPVEMADTYYLALATKSTNANAGNYENISCRSLTTKTMVVDFSGSSIRPSAKWYVAGYAK